MPFKDTDALPHRELVEPRFRNLLIDSILFTELYTEGGLIAA